MNLQFKRSPNQRPGLINPSLIVMHYTASQTLDSAVSWLTDTRAQASAHYVVGLDGEVVQLVELENIAWHAGRSKWRGLSGINRYSVGVEMVNVGYLKESAGAWYDSFDRKYEGIVVDGWAAYPRVQIDAAVELCQSVINMLPSIQEIVGHSDVSPGRKVDPGPAFPMELFRGWVEGRRIDNDDADDVEFTCPHCKTPLNVQVT